MYYNYIMHIIHVYREKVYYYIICCIEKERERAPKSLLDLTDKGHSGNIHVHVH